MYYIEIEDNKIIGKGITSDSAELLKGMITMSKEEYNEIQLPSTFELDTEGNIINITPIPKEPQEPVEPEPTTEEMLLQAYMKIDELENRLQVLEGGV